MVDKMVEVKFVEELPSRRGRESSIYQPILDALYDNPGRLADVTEAVTERSKAEDVTSVASSLRRFKGIKVYVRGDRLFAQADDDGEGED